MTEERLKEIEKYRDSLFELLVSRGIITELIQALKEAQQELQESALQEISTVGQLQEALGRAEKAEQEREQGYREGIEAAAHYLESIIDPQHPDCGICQNAAEFAEGVRALLEEKETPTDGEL